VIIKEHEREPKCGGKAIAAIELLIGENFLFIFSRLTILFLV